MTVRILSATTARILYQLRSDHRTVAMIVLVPTLVMILLYFLYQDVPELPGQPSLYSSIAITMLGIIPFLVMFLVTSIAMQRERSSGTLERLLTTPIRKFDLLGGYALAFSCAAAVQAILACGVTFGFLNLDTAGSVSWVLIIAVLNSILGVALGLLCSAFAKTEFQAVQFMPVVVLPQFLLCGLLVPRDQLPTWLEWISNAMPLSYAVDALNQVSVHPEVTGQLLRDLAIVGAFVAAALTLAAATLRRRTP